MIGINVPIPVPVGYFSFGGWKDSLFGDTKAYGPDAIHFFTRQKAITRAGSTRRTAASTWASRRTNSPPFPGTCVAGVVDDRPRDHASAQ